MELTRYLFIILVMTIITESSVAFIIGMRGLHLYLIIIMMNVLTNPLVNIVLMRLDLRGITRYLEIIILEIAVVLAEGTILKHFAGVIPMKPYKLAFVLNLSSFAAGLIWTVMLIYLDLPL